MPVDGLEAVDVEVSCGRKVLPLAVHKHEEDEGEEEEGRDGAALLAGGSAMSVPFSRSRVDSLAGVLIDRGGLNVAPCVRTLVRQYGEQPGGKDEVVDVDGRWREGAWCGDARRFRPTPDAQRPALTSDHHLPCHTISP